MKSQSNRKNEEKEKIKGKEKSIKEENRRKGKEK